MRENNELHKVSIQICKEFNTAIGRSHRSSDGVKRNQGIVVSNYFIATIIDKNAKAHECIGCRDKTP